MARLFLPLMLAFMLAACTTVPEPVGRIAIAPGVTLRLPAAGQLGQTVEAVQMVTAGHGDDSITFEGRLSVRADGLTLVITDGLGRRAMSVRWSGGRLSVDKASWLPATMPPPANMLADIMLMYWPAEILAAGLDGAMLEATDGMRRLRRDGAVIVEIHRTGDPWNGSAELFNQVWEYHVQVASTRLTP